MGGGEIERQRIQPCAKHPFYWQYKERPVLLLGGSREDNLFQIPDLEEHLDRLASAGGNYVRCTMSSRDPGDVWPFERDAASGRYDLERPGVEYWRRFERFLKLTGEREIILQVELWDRFDFARQPWDANPFNPRNNINYTAGESGLLEKISTHPGKKENAFFRSVPALENNERVLRFQRRHVDQLLALSLPCPNVLYAMDNETNEAPEWGAYWAEYIKEKAAEAGRGAECTEMWDAWDLSSEEHARTLDHPERYSFMDISQNNQQQHQTHWDNAQAMRRRVIESGHIRPLNTVKIYGANSGHFGSSRDGQERFWRNILGGMASTRFHRPDSGLGLSERAQAHIRSMRMLCEEFDIFSAQPHNDLLKERSRNEAYCSANPGAAHAVFFCDGGDVYLDLSAAKERAVHVHWLDILACRWVSPQRAPVGTGMLRLATPRDAGYWCALVKPG